MATKIIIADRKTHFRDAMAKFLGDRGFEVLILENDKQVYEELNQKELPPLIFMSVLLPSRGGYELCKDIKAKEYWSSVKIVLIGEVLVSLKLRQQATSNFKADDCLMIPSKMTDVLAMVEKHIRNSKNKQSSGAIDNTGVAAKTAEDLSAAQSPTSGREPQGDDITRRVRERREKSKQRLERTWEPRMPSVETKRRSGPVPQPVESKKRSGPVVRPLEPNPQATSQTASRHSSRDPRHSSRQSSGQSRNGEPVRVGEPEMGIANTNIDFIGTLQDTPIWKILGFIWRKRLTCILKISLGRLVKEISFRKGTPVFVNSTESSESLGRFLVGNGIISEKKHWQSVQRMLATGRKLGDILISQNDISGHDLFKTLQFQAEEQILLLFGLNDGNYFINLLDALPARELDFDLSVPQLLLKGIRRFFSPETLDTKLFQNPNFVIMPGIPDRLPEIEKFLKPLERKLRRDVAQLLTLEQVASITKLNRFEISSLILVLLSLETLMTNKSDGLWMPAVDEASEVTDWQGMSNPSATNVDRNNSLHFSQMVKNDYARIMQANPVELFGIDKVFDEMELKTAYYSLTKKYRSDKSFAQASKRVQTFAEKIFSKLTESYEFLAQELEATGKDRCFVKDLACVQNVSHENLLKAELNFIKAVALLKTRDYEKALEALALASKLNPHEGEYYAYQGWCLYKVESKEAAQYEKSLELIKKALEINPVLEYPHLFLGKVYKILGKQSEALKEFQLALQCNPDCSEATNELRWLGMQAEKEARKRKLEPEEREMVERIESLYKKLSSFNYFELLQVEPDTSQDIVRKSYFHLVKQYHPDRISDLVDDDLLAMAQEIFSAFTEAYDVLSNPKKKRNYERAILPKKGEDNDNDLIKSRRLFENGKRMIARKNFEKAFELLSQALKMFPQNPVFNAYFGYSVYLHNNKSRNNRLKEALGYLEASIELDSKSYRPYLFLGRIYKQENKLNHAFENFKKAHDYNSKCYEAAYEVKMLDMIKKSEGKSSLKTYLEGRI